MSKSVLKSRPKGLTYKGYRAACAAKSMEPMDEETWKALPVEGDGDGDGGGEGAPVTDADNAGRAPAKEPDGDEGDAGGGDGDGDEGADDEDDEAFERSLAADAAKSTLRKSIEAFNDVVKGDEGATGGVSRETFLHARLTAGTITKSERRELGRLWSGEAEDTQVAPTGQPLRKSLTEYLEDGDRDAVDAMPILKGLFDGIGDKLDALEKSHATDARGTRELIKSLGAVLVETAAINEQLNARVERQDKVIKALGERLGMVEKSPVAPRAVTKSEGVQRPLGGTAGAGSAAAPQLQKSQVLHGLRKLVKGAFDNGDQDEVSRLSGVVANYEINNRITDGDLAAVRMVLQP